MFFRREGGKAPDPGQHGRQDTHARPNETARGGREHARTAQTPGPREKAKPHGQDTTTGHEDRHIRRVIGVSVQS